MNKYEKRFPCEKAIALNAVYDALDAIGLHIDSANSGRGTLIVSSQTTPEISFRIGLSPSISAEETTVEVFCPDGAAVDRGAADALSEEMTAVTRTADKKEGR